MSNKQSVSQWLRTPTIYEEEQVSSKDARWRESLLFEFEADEPVKPGPSKITADDRLQARHILVMMPVGVGLYLGGWLVGRGVFSLEFVTKVSPMIWVVLAVGGGLAFMLKRGLKFGRWS